MVDVGEADVVLGDLPLGVRSTGHHGAHQLLVFLQGLGEKSSS
jgi:hypothetical protein